MNIDNSVHVSLMVIKPTCVVPILGSDIRDTLYDYSSTDLEPITDADTTLLLTQSFSNRKGQCSLP